MKLNLEQYYVYRSLVEDVMGPVRRYRNSILQRLANRWYGLKVVGMRVRIEAVPLKRSLEFPLQPIGGCHTTYFKSDPAFREPVPLRTKEIPLSKHDISVELSIEEWNAVDNPSLFYAERLLEIFKATLQRAEKVMLEDLDGASV